MGKVSIHQLKPKEQVIQIYSGRPGCACGCRGKYWMRGERNFQSMLNKIYKMFYNMLPTGFVYTYEGSENTFVIFSNSPNRTYTMHYK